MRDTPDLEVKSSLSEMHTMIDIDQLLASYPRQRPPLTADHARVYAEQYRLNREGLGLVESLAQRLEQWMHRQVVSTNISGGSILELGAGTLNHRKYEASDVHYDVVEPFSALYEGRPEMSQITTFYASMFDVPPTRRYHRILSIAVLEHMTDLPAEVAASALRLDDDGVFQAGIPSEGGLLWWLGWRLTTGISYFARTGLDYGIVMKHEHVNKASEILAIVKHLFEDVRWKRFPFPGVHVSFYTYLEAYRPRLDQCHLILKSELGGSI